MLIANTKVDSAMAARLLTCAWLTCVVLTFNVQAAWAQDRPARQISNTKIIKVAGFPRALINLSVDQRPTAADVVPLASPDGRHVIYAYAAKGLEFAIKQRTWVGVDGVTLGEFDYTIDAVFSPDSKRTAFIAKTRKTTVVVVDGIVQPSVENTIPFPPIGFSPDSKQVYYQVSNGWVVGGKLHKYSGVPTFSPDGSHLAFAHGDVQRNLVYVDGEERVTNGVVIGSQVLFSPDSKHVAFMTIRPEGVFVNMDGKELPAGGGIQAAAYPQRIIKKRKVVTAVVYDVADWGKPIMTFSPDSNRFAYWGYVEGKGTTKKGVNKVVMVENGMAGLSYTFVSNAVFSRDSKRIAYGANSGEYYGRLKSWIVVDGVDISVPEDRSYLPVAGIALNPDGKRFAYINVNVDDVSHYPYYVFIDGAADSIPYDYASLPVYSSEGKHVAYAASKGKNHKVVVDGSSVPVDGIVKTRNGKAVFFDSDEHIHYVTFKPVDKENTEITIVDETIGAPAP